MTTAESAAAVPEPAGGGSLPDRLARCRDAEDYFRVLEVDHDPQVLDVGRLHVLRLFGRELRLLGELGELGETRRLGEPLDGGDEDQLREVYRAALERAYRALVEAGPLEHRVFQVLRDRAPRGFVPLAEVRIEPAVPSGGRDE